MIETVNFAVKIREHVFYVFIIEKVYRIVNSQSFYNRIPKEKKEKNTIIEKIRYKKYAVILDKLCRPEAQRPQKGLKLRKKRVIVKKYIEIFD